MSSQGPENILQAVITPSKFKLRGGTTLFALVLVALILAVIYLLTRLKKQDKKLEALKRETQQTLNENDIVQVFQHYISSPKSQPFLQQHIAPLILEQQMQQGHQHPKQDQHSHEQKSNPKQQQPQRHPQNPQSRPKHPSGIPDFFRLADLLPPFPTMVFQPFPPHHEHNEHSENKGESEPQKPSIIVEEVEEHEEDEKVEEEQPVNQPQEQSKEKQTTEATHVETDEPDESVENAKAVQDAQVLMEQVQEDVSKFINEQEENKE